MLGAFCYVSLMQYSPKTKLKQLQRLSKYLWFVSLSQSKLTRTKTQHSGTVSGLFYIYQQSQSNLCLLSMKLLLITPSLLTLASTTSISFMPV